MILNSACISKSSGELETKQKKTKQNTMTKKKKINKMATHSSVIAWRIPGTAEPGGLLSVGSHRVGHDWSNLAAAAADSTPDQWNQNLRGLGLSSNIWKVFIYLFLAVLCLPCHSGISLVVASGGYSLVAVRGFLMVVASLIMDQGLSGTWASVVAAHRLIHCSSLAVEHRLSSCGARA